MPAKHKAMEATTVRRSRAFMVPLGSSRDCRKSEDLKPPRRRGGCGAAGLRRPGHCRDFAVEVSCRPTLLTLLRYDPLISPLAAVLASFGLMFGPRTQLY